jgi:hypothetical protein
MGSERSPSTPWSSSRHAGLRLAEAAEKVAGAIKVPTQPAAVKSGSRRSSSPTAARASAARPSWAAEAASQT